jgi:hypothetical protein
MSFNSWLASQGMEERKVAALDDGYSRTSTHQLP